MNCPAASRGVSLKVKFILTQQAAGNYTLKEIKKSNRAERTKYTNIKVSKAKTPALISKITINQNGIQIIEPHMIPQRGKEYFPNHCN